MPAEDSHARWLSVAVQCHSNDLDLVQTMWPCLLLTGSRYSGSNDSSSNVRYSSVVVKVEEVASYFVFDISWDNVEIKR